MKMEIINFGRHKNKSIEEIWSGNYKELNLRIIQDFLNETLDYYFGLLNSSDMILSTGYHFSNNEINLIKWTFKNSSERELTRVTKSQIEFNWKNKIKQKEFMLCLLNYFNYSHLNNPQFNALKHPNNNSEHINFTENSLKISSNLPNPKYVDWLKNNSIKEVENYEYVSKLNSIYPSIVFYFQNESILNYKILYVIK